MHEGGHSRRERTASLQRCRSVRAVKAVHSALMSASAAEPSTGLSGLQNTLDPVLSARCSVLSGRRFGKQGPQPFIARSVARAFAVPSAALLGPEELHRGREGESDDGTTHLQYRMRQERHDEGPEWPLALGRDSTTLSPLAAITTNHRFDKLASCCPLVDRQREAWPTKTFRFADCRISCIGRSNVRLPKMLVSSRH